MKNANPTSKEECHANGIRGSWSFPLRPRQPFWWSNLIKCTRLNLWQAHGWWVKEGCIYLKDKVEPVGSLGAQPRREVAGDPCGRWVLRVLQQEVWADRGLAYHRDKLVGKPNLNSRIKLFKQNKTWWYVPCFLIRGQTGWKHLRKIPE